MYLKIFNWKIEDYVKKQFFITICMNVGHIASGCGIAWLSPAVPKLKSIEQTPLYRPITDAEASWVCSFVYFGCFGAILIAYISNKIGRRLTTMICSVILIVSFILLTWPVNLPMLYVANLFQGFGMTATIIMSLVYLGEIASSNIRGIVLSSTGVFNGFGILLAYAVGPFVSYAGLGYILIVAEIVHFIGLMFMPESPIFYVIKGKEEKARESLERLGRTKDVEAEMRSIIDFVQQQTTNTPFRDLFTIKSNRNALFITTILFLIQNSNGSVVMMLFAMTIFEKANASLDTNSTMIIIGCIIFLGTIAAPIFIEKYGRKFLLVLSTSCCTVSMAALGMYFYLAHSLSAVGWVPLASFVISLFTFYIGVGIIPNTLAGEMFKPNVRSLGTSLVMSIGWVVGLLVANAFSYIAAAFGNHVNFWIFSVVNFIGLFFTLIFIPETKGKSLMEIEAMLAK